MSSKVQISEQLVLEIHMSLSAAHYELLHLAHNAKVTHRGGEHSYFTKKADLTARTLAKLTHEMSEQVDAPLAPAKLKEV